MIARYALPATLAALITIGGYAWTLQASNTRLRAVKAALTEYVDQTKDTANAINNLPDDDAGILAELCRRSAGSAGVCDP
jgi:hypothetical protein